MIENIRLSFQGIWSHKMRSFLTMLGIIIGIASIITIVSTIKGTNEQIKKNLIGAGNNTINIRLYEQEGRPYDINYMGVPDGVAPITEDEYESIKSVDNVVSVSKYYSRDSYDSIFYKDTPLSYSKILGVDDTYFNTCNYHIKSGRGFVNEDFKKLRKVVVLDNNAVEQLFLNDNPIGKTIEINEEPFIVVGVVTEKNTVEPVINSQEDYWTYMQNEQGQIFLPASSWPIVYTFDEPDSVAVRVKNVDEMAKVGKKAADILNSNIINNESLKYKGEDILEQVKDLQEISSATSKQLIWIASISLLVGGIGVMNIMLVSVTERTKEIGLKKAIGAPKKLILAQFLTEAAALTSIGGIIGIIVGIGLAQVVAKISLTPIAISIPAIIISVGFSIVIGIIFGLLPSIKASNLNPIDALRYE